jgi:hypothetical protein
MKKSFVILGILTALIVLVLGTTVNAGEHHVVVVEEKEQLAHANDSLCTENHKLVKENNQLKSENASLVNQLEASKSKDSVDEDLQKKEKEFREKEYLIALYSLEKIVKEELTWISPDASYQAMTEKMGRKPTKEELQGTLEDLYAKGLLYHYVDPDPYMKGNKVAKGEIKKLVDKIVD